MHPTQHRIHRITHNSRSQQKRSLLNLRQNRLSHTNTLHHTIPKNKPNTSNQTQDTSKQQPQRQNLLQHRQNRTTFTLHLTLQTKRPTQKGSSRNLSNTTKRRLPQANLNQQNHHQSSPLPRNLNPHNTSQRHIPIQQPSQQTNRHPPQHSRPRKHPTLTTIILLQPHSTINNTRTLNTKRRKRLHHHTRSHHPTHPQRQPHHTQTIIRKNLEQTR